MHVASYSLRPAGSPELSYAHDLTRSNMAEFYAATGRPWLPETFEHSWPHTENFLIVDGLDTVGILRVMQAADRLYVRDLQVQPERQRQGAGIYALRAARQLALSRGLSHVSIRVFATSAAKALYERAGFQIVASNDDLIQLEWPVG